MATDEFAGNGAEMQAYTPGPWWCRNKVGYVFSDECQIAKVGDFSDKELVPFSAARWTADAHLIAAAPDLHAALSGLLIKVVALYTASAPGGNYDVGNRFADADPDVQAARAALRKAGVTDNG